MPSVKSRRLSRFAQRWMIVTRPSPEEKAPGITVISLASSSSLKRTDNSGRLVERSKTSCCPSNAGFRPGYFVEGQEPVIVICQKSLDLAEVRLTFIGWKEKNFDGHSVNRSSPQHFSGSAQNFQIKALGIDFSKDRKSVV